MFSAALLAVANGAESASSVLDVRGVVPTVCRVDYAPSWAAREDGLIELGRVSEFCNSGAGYRIIAEHAASAAPGALIFHGREVQLDRSGRTVLATVGGPARRSSTLVYRPGASPIRGLDLRVEAAQ